MSLTSLKESWRERAETHFQVNAPKYQALLKIIPVAGTGTAVLQSIHAHLQSRHFRAAGKEAEANAKQVEGRLRLDQACGTAAGWVMTGLAVTTHAHTVPQAVAGWGALFVGMGMMAFGVSREYDSRLESKQRAELAEEIVLRRSTLRLQADYRVDRARHAEK